MAELNHSKSLAVFKSRNSDNYRFSFISVDLKEKEGKVVKEFSNPRRYSFFLGPQAKIHTPEQFLRKKGRVKSLEDLENRFSVEVVNKEFYKNIAIKFTELVGGTRVYNGKQTDFEPALKMPGNPSHKTMQEFGVRLIGRIVFCWFLKKKVSYDNTPLIPNDLLNKKTAQKELSFGYYHNVLEPLFFETLNTPMDERSYEFFNYIHDDLHSLFRSVPFLNGGLFEPNRYDFYDSKDGISNYLNTLNIPDKWFVDLFEILELFNFTIDEATDYDIELSVDPEMLGRILENLLAEINPESQKTARKMTGSYYTPREIVDFMVKESLKEYLSSETGIDTKKIEQLLTLETDPELRLEEKKNLIDTIDSMKVIDPACGSGAFPMGILNKLLMILDKVDPKNTLWLEKQLNISDPILKHEVTQSLENENKEYIRKLSLIQKVIYGVDNQEMAIDMAKLRVFLSLVVDSRLENKKENRGLKPLPNLDFKFVCADTLIDYNRESSTKTSLGYNLNKIDKLEQLREEYFTSSGKQKERIQKEFLETQKQIFTSADQWGLANDYISKIISWNPFSYKPSSWYNPKWMFNVKSFDIVIGNPPYIQLQKNHGGLADKYNDHKYLTFARTGDIYCLFYERGTQLLKENGILTFISSNKWMRAAYGKKLREFFINETKPLKLVDLSGYKVFESATVDTCVVILQKQKNKNHSMKAVAIKDDFNIKSLSDYVKEKSINISELTQENWVILSNKEMKIKKKIESIGKPLKDWDINIFRGVLTGYNPAFIIDTETKERLCKEDPNSEKLIKPILRGKDIKRYQAKWKKLWLIATFPALKINIEDYPAIKKHLLSFGKERLAQEGKTLSNCTKSRKKTGNKWFETQDQIGYHKEFEKEKIVYPNMSKYLPFYLDRKKFYTNQKCFIITNNENLRFLTGFFNSKIVSKWIIENCPELQGGTRELSKIFFENIPLPSPSTNNSIAKKITNLVDEIISEKEKDKDTSKLEENIDYLVYEFYDLNSGEIDVIEKSVENIRK
ncbi:MAG: Eco57I restriction-modification methylase domain-containing protein [Thermotogota bacterium]|nr:Eco57I restriction-modification methylase domain-containing protein [Thermotogota bacterium]